MAGHTRETMIGLFVTIGALMAIAGVVWLGASDIIRGGTSYVAYFDQSVAALGGGAAVRYMGLEVGSVGSISVSPDPTLMAVTMRIRRPDLVTDHTVAEIQTVGFTGVGFIQLKPVKEKVEPRQLGFQPPYPVIPSRSSGGFGELITSAHEIAGTIESLDLQGLVDDLHATVRSARKLVGGPELQHTVANLAEASGRLDDLTGKVDRMVGSDSFQRIPVEAEQALSDAQAAIADARKQIDALRLAQTSREVNEMVGTVNDRSQVVAAQVEDLVRDLRQASDSLNRLLERLQQDPSALIFSQPAPRRNQQ